MDIEELAKKVCEKTFVEQCKICESGIKLGYSLEEYWETNKEYFVQQVKIYLDVKKCLE